MVQIVDFAKRHNADGEEFHTLILQGSLELVKSKTTGNYYATAKRTSITSTFTEKVCQELIGQQLPGSIQRVACEPYEFTVPDTGEVISLEHRWVYLKEGESIDEVVLEEEMAEAETF